MAKIAGMGKLSLMLLAEGELHAGTGVHDMRFEKFFPTEVLHLFEVCRLLKKDFYG